MRLSVVWYTKKPYIAPQLATSVIYAQRIEIIHSNCWHVARWRWIKQWKSFVCSWAARLAAAAPCKYINTCFGQQAEDRKIFNRHRLLSCTQRVKWAVAMYACVYYVYTYPHPCVSHLRDLWHGWWIFTWAVPLPTGKIVWLGYYANWGWVAQHFFNLVPVNKWKK